jgi:hypothetical protein
MVVLLSIAREGRKKRPRREFFLRFRNGICLGFVLDGRGGKWLAGIDKVEVEVEVEIEVIQA